MTDVVVLGTGALGSLFAARLARSGLDVVVAGSWPDGLAAMRERGISVEDDGGVWTARVTAVPRSGPLPLAPLVLVMVKSHQTAAVAPAARRSASAEGLVVTLQNGLGNAEALARAPGRGRVVTGVTTAGASLLGPASVRAFPGEVVLDRAAAPAATDALVARLRAAAFRATAVDDIAPAVWRKLAVNCAINPLSALEGVPNGALARDPLLRERVRAAAAEVAAVARAKGVRLEQDAAEAALDVARATAGNRSSMLQDLDRGAPSEIDALSGAVCRQGRALGVPTPVNAQLWRAVLDRERAAAAPRRSEA